MKNIKKIVCIICILLVSLLLVRFSSIIVGVTFLIIGLGLFVYYNKLDYKHNPTNIIYTPPKYAIVYA